MDPQGETRAEMRRRLKMYPAAESTASDSQAALSTMAEWLYPPGSALRAKLRRDRERLSIAVSVRCSAVVASQEA